METAKRACFLVLLLFYFETRSVVAEDDLCRRTKPGSVHREPRYITLTKILLIV